LKTTQQLALILSLIALVGTPLQAYAQASDLLKRGRGALDSITRSVPALPGGNDETDGSALTLGEIAAGLRDALKVGSERVVAQVGTAEGFNADPEIHIPLPENMQSV